MFCDHELEDDVHLFLQCPFSRAFDESDSVYSNLVEVTFGEACSSGLALVSFHWFGLSHPSCDLVGQDTADPIRTIQNVNAFWFSCASATTQKDEVTLGPQKRSPKLSWPPCHISSLHGPTIMILDCKIRRVATVYFLVFVEGRFSLLGKRSNKDNIDRHLFLGSILRDMILNQACGSCFSLSTKPLLLPVIKDIRSLLTRGFREFHDVGSVSYCHVRS